MNEILETRIQNIIYEKQSNNKPIYQFCRAMEPGEKDNLEYKNKKFINACCTTKNDVLPRNIKKLNSWFVRLKNNVLNPNEHIYMKQNNNE